MTYQSFKEKFKEITRKSEFINFQKELAGDIDNLIQDNYSKNEPEIVKMLVSMLKSYSHAPIVTIDSEFIQPPEYLYGGRFVLTPKTDWDDVHTVISALLKK